MELASRPTSRPKTDNVEAHQQPLMSDSDIDAHPSLSINPEHHCTSSLSDKTCESLELIPHENQQLSTDIKLSRPSQIISSAAGMASAQSSHPLRTVPSSSCISRSKRSIVQGHHHPLSLEEGLDVNGSWSSTNSKYLFNVVRTTSPLPTEEDRDELALRRHALQKLRRRLREELPGYGRGGREELMAVVEPYVPCEWHRRHPASYRRPDLKALGLQSMHSNGPFHGGISECCNWRVFRPSAPNEMIKKEMQKEKTGDGELTEKAEIEKKGNNEFTEKTRDEKKEESDEQVTYFTFISDLYFAEASWPEIITADESRKRGPVLGKTPFGIKRVVGGRAERTYTREEIDAGCIESEEALWWKKKDERRADKEEWSEREAWMKETLDK